MKKSTNTFKKLVATLASLTILATATANISSPAYAFDRSFIKLGTQFTDSIASTRTANKGDFICNIWYYTHSNNHQLSIEQCNYYISRLDKGESPMQIVRDIIFTAKEKSPVYLNSESDVNYVVSLYRALFGRDVSPQASGVIANCKNLSNFHTRDYVLYGFVASTEFKDICESVGINTSNWGVWATEFKNKYVKSVDETYTESTRGTYMVKEAIAKYVARGYNTILGREADRDGYEAWVQTVIDNYNPNAPKSNVNSLAGYMQKLTCSGEFITNVTSGKVSYGDAVCNIMVAMMNLSNKEDALSKFNDENFDGKVDNKDVEIWVRRNFGFTNFGIDKSIGKNVEYFSQITQNMSHRNVIDISLCDNYNSTGLLDKELVGGHYYTALSKYNEKFSPSYKISKNTQSNNYPVIEFQPVSTDVNVPIVTTTTQATAVTTPTTTTTQAPAVTTVPTTTSQPVLTTEVTTTANPVIEGHYDYEKAREVERLINEYRISQGYPAIPLDDGGWKTYEDRVMKTFSDCQLQGHGPEGNEASYLSYNVNRSAQEIVNVFINSKGHKDMILDYDNQAKNKYMYCSIYVNEYNQLRCGVILESTTMSEMVDYSTVVYDELWFDNAYKYGVEASKYTKDMFGAIGRYIASVIDYSKGETSRLYYKQYILDNYPQSTSYYPFLEW